MTRQLIQIVEIDQPFCSHTYGTAPCTAVLGTTGPDRCFNTYTTCQDLAHYSPGIKTLKFCNSLENAPRNDNFFPALTSVDMVPTQLNVGNSDPSSGPLGRRAKVAIRMRDFPTNDRLVDKYWAQRSYDPLQQGTFWTKWLARNQYHLNFKVRVKFGDLNDDPSLWQSREYYLFAVGGPSKGEVTLVAKDVLKLTDSDQAVCPAPSTGVLLGALGTGDTSIQLYPTGVGNSEYPSSGWLRIGREIVTFVRSGDVCSIVRAQAGTTAASANAGDSVQVCAHLNARVDSVVKDLCTVYASIPTGYITFADWQAEADRWLSGRVVDALITEPTGVGKLLGELMEQCAVNIWWDERARQIRFKAIRPLLPTDNVPLFTDRYNVLKDSFSQIEKTEQRITEVWFYYGIKDPSQNADQNSNYAKLNIKIDTLAESTNEYGGGFLTDVAQIKQVQCRWFDASNTSEIIAASARILQRFRDPPVWSQISVDYADATVWVGDIIDLEHYNVVDFYGATKTGRYQIIGAEDIIPGHTVKYTLIPFVFAGRISFICPNTFTSYDTSSTEDRKAGCWITQNDGKMPDGSPGYEIT